LRERLLLGVITCQRQDDEKEGAKDEWVCLIDKRVVGVRSESIDISVLA
jgi:hypothetical protein